MCPFHAENTPSFNVSGTKQFYHCFGCGASGDAIKFLREHDGLTFMEAIEKLAAIANVEIPKSYSKKNDNSKKSRTLINIFGIPLMFFSFYSGGVFFTMLIFTLCVLLLTS